ncbi:MAG: hypothetical protein ABWX84_10720 [Nocardioides sp.]
MRRKSIRSAIVAAGAVAALQLAYFTVTSGPGCTLVAGSRTACFQGNLAVASIGVAMMLIAMTWGFRLFVGLESAALGTLLTVSGVYAVVRVGLEPGWGVSDPVAGLVPILAGVVAFGYMQVALRHPFHA